MKKRIDAAELFYRTEFPTHLQSQAEYSCCCFECGFYDPEGTECISCPKEEAKEHKNSCNKCSDMYAVIQVLQKKHEIASARPNIPLRKQEDLDQLWQDIVDTKNDLDQYRSHIARQVYEERYDQEEIRNLPDDCVQITSDWKHKILECYHRENMMKYFGKKGTSMLGFMLMWNSTDPEERARGVKEVRFVMMLTDDSLQDEWAVVCAKHEIYKNHLLAHIKKAIFVADGASCFASKLHRSIQGLWESWVGVTEVVFRITVAGGGKSCLDGMFGRLSAILSTAADTGRSYWNSETILRATEDAGTGLTDTNVMIFTPDRTVRLHSETNESVDMEGVLRTELRDDGSLTAYRHSGIGGFGISRFALSLYHVNETKKKRTVRRKRRERLDADDENICHSLALSIFNYVGVDEGGDIVHCLQVKLARYFCPC